MPNLTLVVKKELLEGIMIGKTEQEDIVLLEMVK